MSSRLSDEELSQALEQLFLARGFRNLSLKEMASELGCSYRRLYAIAPSKEALFLTIIARFFSRVKKEGWRRAATDSPLTDRIRDYLRVGIEAALRAGPEFNEDIAGFEAGRILFDEFQAERIDGLKALVDEGISDGQFDGFHSQLVAEVMIQAVRRIRSPEFLARSGLTFADGLSELSRLIRFGLLKR
ncbi:TetR/AcrR family transcriptional regulator [Altererythrobacter sp. MF3-039]|uniref:TetR/AcrR family transcriptional regulator n=1 Tax=Altererythrobacter sp. MF3-039 TaxID=3252901 RepID=UPI00390CA5AE